MADCVLGVREKASKPIRDAISTARQVACKSEILKDKETTSNSNDSQPVGSKSRIARKLVKSTPRCNANFGKAVRWLSSGRAFAKAERTMLGLF